MPELRAQEGPQAEFLSTDADVAFYGGAAGGGKSYGLLLDPLHYVDNPAFNAAIFRRERGMITAAGSLWDTSKNIYPLVDAHPRESVLDWTFKSGATIDFAGMEHEKDRLRWQGSQICCEEDTPIVMGDGSTKPLSSIVVGDLVMTLEGPRPVSWIGARRFEPCVTATVRDQAGTIVGTQVQSGTHKVLSPQGWVAYDDTFCGSPLSSSSSARESHSARRYAARNEKKCRSGSLSPDSPARNQARDGGSLPRLPRRQYGQGSVAYAAPAVPGSDYATSSTLPGEGRTLPSVTVPVTLNGLVLQLFANDSARRHASAHESAYVPAGSLLEDYPVRYSTDSHLYDGQDACALRSGQASVPAPSGVGGRTPIDYTRDDQDNTPRCTLQQPEYVHPYTGDIRRSASPLVPGTCTLTPCGNRWVIDLTVDDTNHYCTTTGLVNKNCFIGFDELTHFTADMFFYMLSRNRSTCGVRPYIRATTNPDADSWVAEFIAWWINQETGYPILERSGVIRYFTRVNDVIVWGATEAEAKKAAAAQTRDMAPEDMLVKSFTFIPAKLSDNPALTSQGNDYLASLMALPFVEREQLLGGNWKIRAGAGKIFNRAWWCEFKPRDFYDKDDPSKSRFEQVIQVWDTAFSDKDKPGTAYSVCATWGVFENEYYVLDVFREKIGFPALRRKAIALATLWNPNAILVEAKASGQSLIQELRHTVKLPVIAIGVLPGDDKVKRAHAVSMYVEARKVFLPSGSVWVPNFIEEHAAFPDGTYADQVDTTSMALARLSGGRIGVAEYSDTYEPSPLEGGIGEDALPITPSHRIPKANQDELEDSDLNQYLHPSAAELITVDSLDPLDFSGAILD